VRQVWKRVALVSLAATLALAAPGCKKEEEEPEDEGGRKLGYAEGVTVTEDPDALQKAVDEMYEQAAKGGVPIEFKNEAYSTDGKNFECYIGNPASNKFDMYIGIYADDAMEDELFLSGLIRPGSAFDHIELERELEKGEHVVSVALTQVEEDLETIWNQAFITMNFIVE